MMFDFFVLMIQQRKCKKKEKNSAISVMKALRSGNPLVRWISPAHSTPCMYLSGMFVGTEGGMRTGGAVPVDEGLFSLVGMKIDLTDASDQRRKY